jgi:hypothetical protein
MHLLNDSNGAAASKKVLLATLNAANTSIDAKLKRIH